MYYFKSLDIRNVFSFLALWLGVNLIMANSFFFESFIQDLKLSWIQYLGIILFGIGSFILFKNWADRHRKINVFGNLKTVLVPMAICIMVISPDLLSFFSLSVIPNLWLDFYYFFTTCIVFIFLIDQYFAYYNLILNEGKKNPIFAFKTLNWYFLLGLLFLFVPVQIEPFFYFTYLSVGLLGTLYIGTRFSWVGQVKSDKKWHLVGFLFLVNLVNFFVFIHYTLRIDEYFFEINFYPFAPFFLLLSFVCILGFVSLLSLLFYIPFSDTVHRKSIEIDRLIRIGNLGRDKSQNVELFQYLLKAAVEDTGAERGWFNFKDHEESIIQAKNISISAIEKIESRLYHRLEESFWKEKYFEINTTSHPFIFDDDTPNAHSIISFNYNIDYKEVGRLNLIKGRHESFSQNHVHVVRSYLKQARLSYQSRLLVDRQVEAKRVEEEFLQARIIQQKLLPNYNIVDDAIDFNAFLVPSKELSGDFYDLYKLDNNRMLVILGDIAGKGLTASLYMAEMKGIFQTLSSFDLEPKEFLNKINDIVNSCFESKVFVTLTYLLINKKEKTYTYSRAGQCPLLYYSNKNKSANFFEDEGIGLGIIKNQQFDQKIKIYKHHYEKDDMLVLFSDGISEARNERDEFFGFDRIKKAVEKAPKESAKSINDFINKKLTNHTYKNPNQDDLTSLVIRFK